VQSKWRMSEQQSVLKRKETKGERNVNIWQNDTVTHSSIRTICDNADRVTESVKSGPKVFVQHVYHCPIRMNHTKNYGCESLTILFH
jgi:hypothetical protein